MPVRRTDFVRCCTAPQIEKRGRNRKDFRVEFRASRTPAISRLTLNEAVRGSRPARKTMEIRMKNSIQRAGIAAVGTVLAVLAGWVAYAQASPQLVTQTVNEQVQANKAAGASQSRINALDDETQTML